MPALSLTVATHEDAVIPLEVDTETTLGTLKARLEGVTNVRAANQQLLLNAAPLQGDEKTLGSLGLSNGDLVMLLPAGGLAAPRHRIREPAAQRESLAALQAFPKAPPNREATHARCGARGARGAL